MATITAVGIGPGPTKYLTRDAKAENMENVGSGVSLLESGAAYRNRTDT